MLQAVFNALFKCAHRRTTFPRAYARTSSGAAPGTYVVCLECGSEIPYDWGRMRFGPQAALAAGMKGRPRREPARAPAGRAPRAADSTKAKDPPETGPPAEALSEVRGGPPVTLAAAPEDSAAGQPPAPPERPTTRPASPSMARPRAALPTAAAFRPYLFAKSPAEPARAPNGARTAAEGDVRRYLDRAGLRFRKVQVALRVLNALMAGAPAQPEDVALLESWAGPNHRGCSAEALARQVVEWAGSR